MSNQENATESPQANTELDEILALIQLEIDYADTHGGCPPAVKGVTRKGVAEAKARLLAWNKATVLEARIDELKRATPFINSQTYIEAREFELTKEEQA